MPGQAFNKKLDEMQTTNMIRKTATDAINRKQRIENAVKDIHLLLREYIMVVFIILYVFSSTQSTLTEVLSWKENSICLSVHK